MFIMKALQMESDNVSILFMGQIEGYFGDNSSVIVSNYFERSIEVLGSLRVFRVRNCLGGGGAVLQ